MPRPTKAFRRMKVNAALEYKRGNRTEAYKMWEKAAAQLKEVRQAKRVRHQKKDEPATEASTEEAAAESTS